MDAEKVHIQANLDKWEEEVHSQGHGQDLDLNKDQAQDLVFLHNKVSLLEEDMVVNNRVQDKWLLVNKECDHKCNNKVQGLAEVHSKVLDQDFLEIKVLDQVEVALVEVRHSSLEWDQKHKWLQGGGCLLVATILDNKVGCHRLAHK